MPRKKLAKELGVSPKSLERLQVGWDGSACTFPERDASGVVIGICRRYDNGKKLCVVGSKRGLTFDVAAGNMTGPILIVEGGTDTAAGMTLGLATIGRPSALGGGQLLTGLLAGTPVERQIIVLGENDEKPDGRWPGRDGAISTAEKLAESLDRSADWALPPDGAKDLREWLSENGNNRDGFLTKLEIETIEPPEQKSSSENQATRLVQMVVESRAEFFHSPDGEPFVTLTVESHKETHRVRGEAFREWLSDALCRLSTGSGYSVRELYSNDGEKIFNVQRPVLINGITELSKRSDLLDRTIAVTLPTISETRRKTESEVWDKFNAARPRILGALLTAVSTALRNESGVRPDRIAHLKGGNEKADQRIDRRELSSDEIQSLLDATRTGPKRLGLTGEQRFLLYAAGMGSGLRASELASLTPAHFDLAAEPPTVRIDTADEKARRGDVLPLPPDLTALFFPVFGGMDDDSRLWPGPWAKQKRASKFIRSDLEAARSAWIKDAETAAEHDEREQSNFLCYRDHDGKQADFHALRHTYLSRLGRSGASPKAMQRLARHSTVELTLGRYTHAGLYDLAAAVDRLPSLPVKSPSRHQPAVLQATGTDGGGESLGAPVDAKPCGTMTTGDETEASDDDEEPSPQVLSLTTIEDDCGHIISGEGGTLAQSQF